MVKYRVTTCNFLPGSKKYFDTMEECTKHLKEIIKHKEDWVDRSKLLISYRIDSISDEWFENKELENKIKAVFREKSFTPVNDAYTMQRLRDMKVSKNQPKKYSTTTKE